MVVRTKKNTVVVRREEVGVGEGFCVFVCVLCDGWVGVFVGTSVIAGRQVVTDRSNKKKIVRVVGLVERFFVVWMGFGRSVGWNRGYGGIRVDLFPSWEVK